MTVEQQASALSSLLREYRRFDGVQVDADSVLRWVYQFDNEVRSGLLSGITDTLARNYIDVSRCRELLRQMFVSPNLTGGDPLRYWSTTEVIQDQERGRSQSLLVALLYDLAAEHFGAEFRFGCAGIVRSFYLDDFLFSGQRLQTDFSRWLARVRRSMAPPHLDIHLIGVHLLGLHFFQQYAEAERMTAHGVTYRIFACLKYENRRRYRSESAVYWPSITASSVGFQAFDEGDLVLREVLNPAPNHEGVRQLLERELLRMGCKIAASCRDRTRSLRPLGYSSFGYGFGATCASYLNCPNNAPLALWWTAQTVGMPNGWHALLPRRTND
jgi:hypothetical protein